MSERTIATWRVGETVQLSASVKLKTKDKQQVTYLLTFDNDDHEVEIDAKDARVLIAGGATAQLDARDDDDADDDDDEK